MTNTIRREPPLQLAFVQLWANYESRCLEKYVQRDAWGPPKESAPRMKKRKTTEIKGVRRHFGSSHTGSDVWAGLHEFARMREEKWIYEKRRCVGTPKGCAPKLWLDRPLTQRTKTKKSVAILAQVNLPQMSSCICRCVCTHVRV
jgi:hypothetical protein